MVAVMSFLHLAQALSDERRTRFLRTWRPLLIQSLENPQARLPRIRKPNIPTFVNLWLHLHESLTGIAKHNLNLVAHRTGIRQWAQRMLSHGNVRRRLIATSVLGHLGDISVWHLLVPVLYSENSYVSLAAARALVQINRNSAIKLIVPLIVSRNDWPSSRVIAILKEAGPDVTTVPLAQAAIKVPPHQTIKIVKYLQTIHSGYSMETIGLVMRISQQPDVLAACLELLTDPRDVELVREYVTNPNWHVRVQAATALGRIGTQEDVPKLVELLNDDEWWVRYRAAQALSNLPFFSTEELKGLIDESRPSRANDILRHVLAEKNLE